MKMLSEQGSQILTLVAHELRDGQFGKGVMGL
jgi:hypothetical protein